MPIEKPLPLMVGNKAYYSLTSYDPVEITVNVPYTAEEDVDYALEVTLREMGGTVANLDDPAWVEEHFNLTTKEQVHDAMRHQVELMNAQIAEEQKMGKCVQELASRLAQSVPPQIMAEARQAVQMRFTQQLQADGMTPSQFMARTHTTTAQLETMFDAQARMMAEGDAALSAFAREKKLKVDEMEYGRLLGIPADEVQGVIDQAGSVGQLDQLRDAALAAKAAQIVVAECSCTYKHESPEVARARIAQYRRLEQMFADEQDDEPEESGNDAEPTGFKLV